MIQNKVEHWRAESPKVRKAKTRKAYKYILRIRTGPALHPFIMRQKLRHGFRQQQTRVTSVHLSEHTVFTCAKRNKSSIRMHVETAIAHNLSASTKCI